MRFDDDGYKVEMTVSDVAETYTDPVPREIRGVWVGSCFGPMVCHEMVAFKTKREAFNWVLSNMSNHLGKNDLVDEMSMDCWKDIYNSGTEWEIRFLVLPD